MQRSCRRGSCQTFLPLTSSSMSMALPGLSTHSRERMSQCLPWFACTMRRDLSHSAACALRSVAHESMLGWHCRMTCRCCSGEANLERRHDACALSGCRPHLVDGIGCVGDAAHNLRRAHCHARDGQQHRARQACTFV